MNLDEAGVVLIIALAQRNQILKENQLNNL
jgi:hypothetical protein